MVFRDYNRKLLCFLVVVIENCYTFVENDYENYDTKHRKKAF